MPVGMKVGLGPDDIVLHGDPAHFPQKGGLAPSPIFAPFVLWPNGWMHQNATWYGFRPQPRGLCVRCGPSSPLEKGARVRNFCPRLLWPNGWMDEDATWYSSRPRPRPHCITRGPSSLLKGHSSPPLFSAHVYCGYGRPSQLLLSSCYIVML